jgi:hypothetical protein
MISAGLFLMLISVLRKVRVNVIGVWLAVRPRRVAAMEGTRLRRRSRCRISNKKDEIPQDTPAHHSRVPDPLSQSPEVGLVEGKANHLVTEGRDLLG